MIGQSYTGTAGKVPLTMGNSSQVIKQGVIGHQMGRLDEAICGLENVEAILAERVTPILANDCPEKTSGEVPHPPTGVAIADVIDCKIDRINRVVKQIHSIIDRVEL